MRYSQNMDPVGSGRDQRLPEVIGGENTKFLKAVSTILKIAVMDTFILGT